MRIIKPSFIIFILGLIFLFLGIYDSFVLSATIIDNYKIPLSISGILIIFLFSVSSFLVAFVLKGLSFSDLLRKKTYLSNNLLLKLLLIIFLILLFWFCAIDPTTEILFNYFRDKLLIVDNQLIEHQGQQDKQLMGENNVKDSQFNEKVLTIIKSSENISVFVRAWEEDGEEFESLVIDKNGIEFEIEKEKIQGICNNSQKEETQFCGFLDLKFFPSEDYFTYRSAGWESDELYFYDLKNMKYVIGPFGPQATASLTEDGKHIYIYRGAGMWPIQLFYVYSSPEFKLITNSSEEVPIFDTCLEENGIIICSNFDKMPVFTYNIINNKLKIDDAYKK